ncbi:NADH-quinone oxidoreductase subunit D [Celeribacter baekdonensis]|uniref:NADH-quinone oxidoreductase subunit D n=2 Tax=Celeribacter baekdonensis TaxID=875171 RepID=A0A2R4M2V0_9RHOB|nr:NADH-quinone oxidoreductase subunit D [Celeribacter baekdonensis]|tara:strand:+ start:45061 stop:46239 length:1179 start_codon:yes stop_codon:yes gene_type:complete
MFSFKPDRAQYPQPGPDGTLEIDLETGKYLKLWHGPNHPGITGNMSVELTVCGDEVAEGKVHVGYLHRGFEKLMERRTFIQVFPIVCRVCVPEPDFNEYCYAAAIEELAGIDVPEMAQWIRTLILEMGRFNSYMMAMGGISGALGLGVVGQWMTYTRDLMLDRFEELTGARIYHMFILPGGVRAHLPEGFEARMEEVLSTADRYIADAENLMFKSSVFKTRTQGVGTIDPALFDRYGVTGPNARAGGVAKDVRKDSPYLVYDQLDFTVHTEQASDIYARTLVRYNDLKETIQLIRQILQKMPKTGAVMGNLPNVLHWKIPRAETYIKGESSRGEYGYYVVTDGTAYPRRINVRGPSYTHAMALLEHLIPGTNISDVAALMVSLHTYPPEIER